MSKPSVSLCVTAYCETSRGYCSWIRECIAPACDSTFIDEIVVVNDGTSDYPELAAALRDMPKLRFVHNPERLHVFGNKLESVWQATSDWVLMCDSDNVMGSSYYRTLQSVAPWKKNDWFCASQAEPTFNYGKFVGKWKLPEFLKLVARDPSMFWCFVNTGNQFVHRETFLNLFDRYRGKRFDLEQPDYFGARDRSDEKWFLAYGADDSFFMLKEWLMAGYAVHCVDGLKYVHRTGIGKLSNYERGPALKDGIPNAYYLEMLDHANGEKHGYTFRSISSSIAKLDREDGKHITFNRATGQVTV